MKRIRKGKWMEEKKGGKEERKNVNWWNLKREEFYSNIKKRKFCFYECFNKKKG